MNFYIDIEFNGSVVNKKIQKGKVHHTQILSIQKKRGYGEIGRRYGLNWFEPQYGNLLSDNFQTQRNPGIKKMGNPEPTPAFQKERIKKDRCRDSMEAVLTNGVDCLAL